MTSADIWVLYVSVLVAWGVAWNSFRKSTTPPGLRRALAVRTALAMLIQGVYLVLSYFIAAKIGTSVTGFSSDIDFAVWFTAPASSPIGDPVFWIWFATASGVAVTGWSGVVVPWYRAFTWLLLGCGFIACFVPYIAASEQADPVLVEQMRRVGLLAVDYEVTAALTVCAPNWCMPKWSATTRLPALPARVPRSEDGWDSTSGSKSTGTSPC